MQTPPLAGGVVGAIDGFLNVATRFSENFSHFARHFGGAIFLALDQNFGGAKKNFGAFRSRRKSPLVIRSFGGINGKTGQRVMQVGVRFFF